MASIIQELKFDSKGLKTVEDYEKQFDLIAQKLLNECCLQINDRPHRFVEIEFYYTDSIHADPFTHKDKDQKTCGQWYFHKIGSQYKGGTYKGLDLTCGSSNAHGGILIRGIQDLQTGEFKDGSCVCVDHILELNQAGSIKDLTTLKRFSFDVTSGSTNCIVDDINLPKLEIVKSARVGLNMKKKEDNQTEFVMKPYRYLSCPSNTKKGKIHVALTLHMQGKSASEIQRITGSSLTSIQNWIELYQSGSTTNITDYVNMALDNESLCKVMGAWAKQYYKSNSTTTATNQPQIVTASTIQELSALASNSIESNLPQFRSMFNALRMQLNSYNANEALEALIAFRKFLSLPVEIAPMQEVYEAGLIPKFAEFLRRTDNTAMQVSAAWALSNIACSPYFKHIQAIFDAEVLEYIMPLLSSNNEEMYDQTLWLVANLLGHINDAENEKIVQQYRKKSIEMGIIPTICQLGLYDQKPAVAANIAWALDNVLRGYEFVPQSQALSTLPVLAKLIKVANEEATSYGAMAIARLMEKHDETIIQRVLDIDGMTDTLMGLFETGRDTYTKSNTSKAFANMTAGTPQQVLELLNRGLMQKMLEVFTDTTANPAKVLIENIAKILEHVTLAADEIFIDIMMEEDVFGIGQKAPAIKKKHNYIWALSNATFAANEHQLDYFITQDLHKQLAAALSDSTADKDLTVAILEGLENLLKRGPKVARSVPELKKWLQNQTSNDPEIQSLADRLARLCN